jgi:hypothetical protein
VTAEDETILRPADPWGPGARWGERTAGIERIVEVLRAAEGTEVLLTPVMHDVRVGSLESGEMI